MKIIGTWQRHKSTLEERNKNFYRLNYAKLSIMVNGNTPRLDVAVWSTGMCLECLWSPLRNDHIESVTHPQVKSVSILVLTLWFFPFVLNFCFLSTWFKHNLRSTKCTHFKYAVLMSLDKYVHSCSQDNQGNEHYPHQKVPLSKSIPTSAPAPGNHCSAFCHYRLDLPVLGL